MKTTEIKEQLSQLNLHKYYDGFERDNFSEDYSVLIYMLNSEDERYYIGNAQIPSEYLDRDIERRNIFDEWWHLGDSHTIIPLHIYSGTDNRHYHHNQPKINKIKQLIISQLKTNLNVQIVPQSELDDDAIYKSLCYQIGRNQSLWKKKIKHLFKEKTSIEVKQILISLYSIIAKDEHKWCNILGNKNRYWFISNNNYDIEDRKNFGVDNLTEEQLCILIYFKEYIAYQIFRSHNDLINNKKSFIETTLSDLIKYENLTNELLYTTEVSNFRFGYETEAGLFNSIKFARYNRDKLNNDYITFKKCMKEYKYIINQK